MKTEKKLEKLLNKNGWKLEWKKYNYWDCVPFAVKGEKEIALCFNTENTIYKNYCIATVLEINMTAKELEYLLDKMEHLIDTKKDYLINHSNLGNIKYLRNKTITEYSYICFE